MIVFLKLWLFCGVATMVVYFAWSRQSNWLREVVGTLGIAGLLILVAAGIILWPRVLLDMLEGTKPD